MRDSTSYSPNLTSRKQITDITYQNNRTHFRVIDIISGE
jgi:hypothetical protein